MTIDDIYKLCARPQGLCLADLGLPNRSSARVRVQEHVTALEKAGKIHKAKVSHKRVYWFANKHDAETAMNIAAGSRAKRGPENVPREARSNEPLKTDENTKYTLCPSNPPRFQIGAGISFGMQRGRVTR